MIISSEELASVFEAIWSSVLELPVEPSTPDDPVLSLRGLLTGTVHITGGFSGALLVECPTEFARLIAGRMFAMEPSEVGESEVRDAIGEIANIAGGNLKALCPPPSQLSLPTVVDGASYHLVIAGTRRIAECRFRCQGHVVAMRLLERTEGKSKPL